MDKIRQIERLLEVENSQWEYIITKLDTFVKYKTHGNLKSGAFSERSLGEPAEKYFVHESIKKLWECTWEWRDDLQLEQQLRLIIVSMMSEAVRKFKQRGGKDSLTLNENLKIEADIEESNSDFYEWAELAVDGDDDLEQYLKAFKKYGSPPEIAQEMGIAVKDVYNLTKRLKRKLETAKLLWIQ